MDGLFIYILNKLVLYYTSLNLLHRDKPYKVNQGLACELRVA